LYVHEDEQAVRHLLTVGCSLDSMVVGEPQIIGQVKDCYRLATACQSTGKVINRLFHCAFATSKEVYSSTSIAQRRVSVAGVAVELARQLFADLTRARIVVIGAGDMGELLIKHLRDENCNNIMLVNRTYERGKKTADQYGIQAAPWDTLAEQVGGADIIIAAAVADQFLFTKTSFRKIIEHRKRALLIIDIAVPRNFDPAINKLDDVFLYSVDDLAGVAQENLAARQEDITSAREIIEDNVISFMDWFGVSDIGPLIGRLRSTFNQIGRNELAGFLSGEKELDTIRREQLETMVNRTTNKLAHRLVNSLFIMAKQRGSDEAADFINILLQQKDRDEK
jgi:glutamyl-tRNA reductase